MYFSALDRATPESAMPLAWIALNSIRGLGPVKIHSLLERYGNPEAVLSETPSVLAKITGIPLESAGALRDSNLLDAARRQYELSRELGIEVLTLADERYPPMLREIFAPPPVLFAKGDLMVFKRHSVAIVGTRKPTPYGRSAAEYLSRELTAHGLAVVSGLALGVDTVAHQTCLDAGGGTIAVLGCGIDVIYPSANRQLAARIVRQGILVSEFPLETPPESFNFPRRNRIISGLSAGVLVVEAGEKSGSLITAHYALQQSRDIFAVPGSIFSEKSIGTINLLKRGAQPVRTAADVLDAIVAPSQVKAMTGPPAPLQQLSMDLMSRPERDVYEALAQTPVRLDQLADTTAKTIPELLGILLNLELKGLVRQLSGQQFVRA